MRTFLLSLLFFALPVLAQTTPAWTGDHGHWSAPGVTLTLPDTLPAEVNSTRLVAKQGLLTAQFVSVPTQSDADQFMEAMVTALGHEHGIKFSDKKSLQSPNATVTMRNASVTAADGSSLEATVAYLNKGDKWLVMFATEPSPGGHIIAEVIDSVRFTP